MRFAQVHKFAAYTLAILGLVALGAGGELQGLTAVVIAVAVVASWFVEGDLLHSTRYARFWNAALVLGLAAELARATLTETSALTAAVEFAALLQISRLAYRRTARDYQQITVLALLHLIAATVLGGGLSYAVCFLGFVIATPWAMTLGHLRREIEGNYLADARAGRAGVPIDVARILRSRRVVGPGLLVGSSLLAVPIFLLTAVIFVLFPRIGIGVLSLRQRNENAVAGFGTSVDLAGHGVIRDDPTIVLRVEPLRLGSNPPPLRAFRLRGATFDHYNGRSWTRRPTRDDTLAVERDGPLYRLSRWPNPRQDEILRVVLDPLDPPVVLVPEGTVGLRIDPRIEAGYPRWVDLSVDRDDEVRYGGADDLGLVYTAYVRANDVQRVRPHDARELMARYLQLPTGMNPEVRRLAERLTAGQTTVAGKAHAIERHLASFRYTLSLESGRAAHPVEDFLFRTHAGHCEYFSTAMAVLLRSVGVPTRNVTGFLGGTFNRYGRFYAIRQGDAHSWVEVYDPARGWTTYDPTPPAGEVPVVRTGVFAEADAVIEAMRVRWRRYIVGFDLSTQARLAMRVVRFMEGRRARQGFSSGRWDRRPSASLTSHAKKVQWKALAGAVGLLALAAVLARRWRAAGGASAHRPPPTREVRDAQALARALDAALAARGHVRPPNRSPLAFARDLARKAAPLGPVAVRVAERYVAARFGDDALAPGELDALRAELRAATRTDEARPDN